MSLAQLGGLLSKDAADMIGKKLTQAFFTDTCPLKPAGNVGFNNNHAGTCLHNELCNYTAWQFGTRVENMEAVGRQRHEHTKSCKRQCACSIVAF